MPPGGCHMTGKYQITATRSDGGVLRQGFDDLDQANHALAELLARDLDCEIRLTQDGTVLFSAAPSRKMASLLLFEL
jgi:hypothetical protein